MSSDMLLASTNQLVQRFNTSLMYAEALAGTPDNHYAMFRSEDLYLWVTFSITFCVLICFDNIILNRTHKIITVTQAALYTLFWIGCAFGFAAFVYYRKGRNAAFDWTSGYLLEWMLSFDNLFVFHLVFRIYGTPDHLKHKPLFWGICGAVFFRLIFIFIGEFIMHAMWAAHLMFGGFLVYTGIHSAMIDEDDEDPTKNRLVRWLAKAVPFVPCYDAKGSFFVRVPINKNGEAILPETVTKKEGIEGGDLEKLVHREECEENATYGTVEFTSRKAALAGEKHEYGTRVTMLFLVVCCLEVSDILFAVDSTSAIVAQVSDLFLAYTSAVFAMLGLRATFFIIDVLVKIFSLLKYGVALVLVFIGIKLIISKMYHIPPMLVCGILFGILALSMLCSASLDFLERRREEQKSVKC
eukprot:GEMP01034595.1.p1 GENE.GEMP01034595.1~~GEMP01034595.1.p1  ORF type:complete len:412 (+),score=97.02 GEMP01034595.1:201-1436(+)